jgi:signal transduction histidine kinase/ligand-binding sensor domain-containing protein
MAAGHSVVPGTLARFSAHAATIAGVMIALSCARAFALDPERSFAQLHHTAWTAEVGAPSQISALAQTTDGYLWIGSARGLFRFDGVEFERYAPLNLPSHNTYALLATPDGGLWISFRPSGIGFVKGDGLTTFVQPHESPKAHTYAFALDHDGGVWSGTHDGLTRFDGSRWRVIGLESNLAPSRVQALYVDGAGTLWVADANGVHSLARGATAFATHDVRIGWISELAQEGDRLWLSGDHPMTALAISAGSGRPTATINMTVVALIVDRDGCLWGAASHGEGLRRVRAAERLGTGAFPAMDHQIESMRESDGLSADAVHELFEDREGNIWVGTAKGLDRFRHNHFVPVTLPDGYQSLTLLAGEEGAVWVGNASGKPLLRVRDGGMDAMPVSPQASCVYRDAEGVTWWGCFDQLVRQERNTFRSFTLPKSHTPEWMWEVFRSDVDDAVWVNVGDSGLYHFRAGAWERRPSPAGLPNRGPSASYHAPDGRIWLGYTENRACVLDGERVRAYTQADGIEIGRVRVIRGRGPHYWLGGELGLSLFKDGRFRTVACSGDEPFGTISGIVETSDGGLWLNEMRGVVHVSADEVARVLSGPVSAVKVRRYDVHEGLPGAGQMNWTCSTAIEATDGRLWFATDGGLAWIDPRRITINERPPHVTIRAVRTEAGPFDMSREIRLPNDPATLRIDYTALSLTIPERVRFRYRLEGYDAGWIDAGARRTAFYTRLRPGSYRFQVAASNNDGVWNATGATVSFMIAPAFYQTRWFAVACLTAILGALWIAYALRVRHVAARLQRLHDERVDERMQIAHELHDTLLQGFLSASMQLHVARDAIPGESSAKSQVSRVLGLMDEVIGEARNTVRGLRTPPDAPELEQAFTRIHQEFAGNGSVDFRVVVIGHARPLQPVARDEVYRIGRESLTNAFRHANARTIEAEIHYLPNEMRVVVRDDGRGIDADVLRTGRDGHWGLSGMRERAKRIDARLALRSRLGSGTEIELVIPGRVAFADAPPPGTLRRWWRRARAGASRAQHGGD